MVKTDKIDTLIKEYENHSISDHDTDKLVKLAVERELDKKKVLNQPIAVYDKKTGKIFAEYGDGRKVEIGQGSNKKFRNN